MACHGDLAQARLLGLFICRFVILKFCTKRLLNSKNSHSEPYHKQVRAPRRSVVERLSVPGVRRLFIMDPATRRVEGLVSLSDVAAFLFDVM